MSESSVAANVAAGVEGANEATPGDNVVGELGFEILSMISTIFPFGSVGDAIVLGVIEWSDSAGPWFVRFRFVRVVVCDDDVVSLRVRVIFAIPG